MSMTPRSKPVVEVELIDIDAFSPSLERIETTLDVVVINELIDTNDVENSILSHDHEESSTATNLREQLLIVSTSRTKECVLHKVDLIDLTED
jgi:hypothetical protein